MFAEENQGVVAWAFDRGEEADDPNVWQGQPSAERSHPSYEWFSEDLTVSRFIVEMLRNTIANSYEDS